MKINTKIFLYIFIGLVVAVVTVMTLHFTSSGTLFRGFLRPSADTDMAIGTSFEELEFHYRAVEVDYQSTV